MKKGSYTIQEGCDAGGTKGGGGWAGGGGGGVGGGGTRPVDTSYSACLLALLIFLALCVIIMLAAWPWSRDKPHNTTTTDNGDRPEHEGYSGRKTTEGTPIKPKENKTEHHPIGTTTANPLPGDGIHPSLHPNEEELPPHGTGTTDDDYDYREPGHGATTRHPGAAKGGHSHPAKGGHRDDEGSAEWVRRGEKAGKDKEKLVLLRGEPTENSSEVSAPTATSILEKNSTKSQPTITSTNKHLATSTTDPSLTHKPSSTTSKAESHAPATASPVHIVSRMHTTETISSLPPSSIKTIPTESSVVTKPVIITSGSLPPSPTPPTTISDAFDDVATDTKTKKSIKEASISSTTQLPVPGDLYPRVLKAEEIETPVQKNNITSCETPSCKFLSSRMLAFMNHSADPCQNFYNYACGGMRGENSRWITEVTSGSDSWSRISDMMHRIDSRSPMSHQKFKSFYESCLGQHVDPKREDSINEVRKIIASAGRFYRSDEWVEESGILTELLGKLLKYHFSPLLDIILDVDSDNSSKFAIKLTAPVFKSPFGDSSGNDPINLSGWPKESCIRTAIVKPEDGKKVDFNKRYEAYASCAVDYQQYIHYAEDAILKVNVIQHLNETETPKLVRDSVIYMDVILGEIIPQILPKTGEKKRILLSKEFKKYTIKELKEKFSLIDWQQLISMLLEYTVPEDTVVQVYFESYFKSFFQKLKDDFINERQVNNALMTMFTHEMYYGLVMHRYPCNRENYCLKVSRDLMDDVSSALFLKSFSYGRLSEFQSMINSTFNELIFSLKSEISKISWMDGDSQISALEKVRNMKLFADGGVSVFLNDTYLDSQFHELPMNSTYLENAILLLQRYRKRMYMAYEKNPSEPEQIWSHFLQPYENLGKVIYGMNAIVIPYGMMSKPFFSEDYPMYIQMASLGHMLAHEICHHFDSAGVLHEFDGLRKNLLSSQSMSKMDVLAKCTMDQLSTQQVEIDDDGQIFEYKLDPAVSLNERLADIGASHLAYSSLWGGASGNEPPLPWSSMTPQQLFFLSMAQNYCTKSSVYDYAVSIFESEHLPPFKRINDIAFNSREFAGAFSCPAAHTPRCDPFHVDEVTA